jgi:hypothetical protein
VHDGRHIPWKAGDVMIVENAACISTSTTQRRRGGAPGVQGQALFLFMHLLFQKIVEWPSKIPPKGAENYKPPSD